MCDCRASLWACPSSQHCTALQVATQTTAGCSELMKSRSSMLGCKSKESDRALGFQLEADSAAAHAAKGLPNPIRRAST